MTVEELKEYLNHAIEIEKIVYTQDQMIDELNKKINSLGKAKSFSVKAERETESPALAAPAFVWPIFFLGLAIALFLGGSSCEACYVIGAFPLIVAVLLLWLCISGVKMRRKERREAHQEYIDGLIDVQAAMIEDEERVKQEKVLRSNLLKQGKMLVKKYNETKELRDKLYSLDIIFPKYRNLVAICSFYEYLISGRCTKLEGHEGAYNIFENEIRMNMIISNLQEVLSHLKQIEQNQYMLHAAISEGNQKVDALLRETVRISSKIDCIADQSAIAAQNTEWAAQELNTIKWLEIMRS